MKRWQRGQDRKKLFFIYNEASAWSRDLLISAFGEMPAFMACKAGAREGPAADIAVSYSITATLLVVDVTLKRSSMRSPAMQTICSTPSAPVIVTMR